MVTLGSITPSRMNANELALMRHWRGAPVRLSTGGSARDHMESRSAAESRQGTSMGRSTRSESTGGHQAAISQASRPAPTPAPAPSTGRSIYSDIKIADPVTGRILNPDIYGGIVVEKNGHKYSTGNDDLAYNDAIDKWGHRTFGDRVANFLAPFGLTSVKPDYSRPATYAGGDFHTGINPASAAVGAIGSLVGLNPIAGLLASQAAGYGYEALGGHNPVLGGPRTVYADDGTGGTVRDTSPSTLGGLSSAKPGASSQNAKGDQSGTIGSLVASAPASTPAPAAVPTPPPPSGSAPEDENRNRWVTPYGGNPLTYGESGGEWQYWHPDQWPLPEPVAAKDGGKIKPKGGRSQAMQAFSAVDPSLRQTVAAVFRDNPALAAHRSDYAVITGKPVDGRSGQLESYPPEELYNPIPGKATTEVYNQDPQTLQSLVTGDMLHRLGAVDFDTGAPVDPAYRAMKMRLLKSMTPEQTADSKKVYQRYRDLGDPRTFGQFMDNSRGDEFIMGSLTPDKGDYWRGRPGTHQSSMYTPEQDMLLNQMRKYLEGHASGGSIGSLAPVRAINGGSIKGPGDGQSDSIPALLSNNEHVIDATTVALAGRGDSEAGHRAIEKWKQDVRRKAGLKNPKKAPLMGSIGSLMRAA